MGYPYILILGVVGVCYDVTFERYPSANKELPGHMPGELLAEGLKMKCPRLQSLGLAFFGKR